jgi:hypothetical protein
MHDDDLLTLDQAAPLFVSIEHAARTVHMNRDALKARCIQAGIALRWGGTDRHPRLRVTLADVEAMLRANVYTPGTSKPRLRRAPCPSRALHPDVRC